MAQPVKEEKDASYMAGEATQFVVDHEYISKPKNSFRLEIVAD